MTGEQAIQHINALGLKQAQFARLARVHVNTVTKWANGTPPSSMATAIIDLLRARPELVTVMQSINKKKKTIDEITRQAGANQATGKAYRKLTAPQ